MLEDIYLKCYDTPRREFMYDCRVLKALPISLTILIVNIMQCYKKKCFEFRLKKIPIDVTIIHFCFLQPSYLFVF